LFCARGKAGFYEKQGFTARVAEAPGMELTQFDKTIPAATGE
jgi:hypothetical protein